MSAIKYDLAGIESRPATVAKEFYERVAKSGDKEAYRFPVGAADQWESVSWRVVGDRVTRLAAGLLALGIEPGQRVGIASSTRYEWILADLAVMTARAATTTVYPTTLGDEVAYILGDSECRIVIAEDDVQLAKILEHKAELPLLQKVVVIAGAPRADDDWVIGFDDLEWLGAGLLAEQPDVVTRTVDAGSPDDLATLIYTSGTTGRPKGVRLNQSAWTYEGAAIVVQELLGEDDFQFLWLPLAHSFGKVLLSVQLAVGFPTAVDGRIDKIIDNLPIVRPTFMGAAPRIFEKAYAGVQSMMAAEGGIKKVLFDRAFATGTKVRALKAEGRSVPLPLKLELAVLDHLVFSKIRARFGGRIRFFISGSAALNPDIAEWFDIAGLQILEGYGLTESSAGTFVNHPDDNVIGTVGPVFPGTDVQIAEDGEILLRGPGVMDGYHNLPEQTAETLQDGWLHTGDIGEITPGGHLRVTDRKKDLFKTSGGKYVAPSLIEGRFKAICPQAGNILVHGNERNFVSALVSLDPVEIEKWAQLNGVSFSSYAELVASPQVHELVQDAVDQLNLTLNRWETIKRFVVLDHELSVESGELTPSLKVKRKVVEEVNKAALDELYG